MVLLIAGGVGERGQLLAVAAFEDACDALAPGVADDGGSVAL